MAKECILWNPISQYVLKGADIIDPFTPKRTLTKEILVHFRDHICVWIKTGLT
jgi:hypothetical protein